MKAIKKILLIPALISFMAIGMSSAIAKKDSVPTQRIASCIEHPFRGKVEQVSIFAKIEVKKGILYQVIARVREQPYINETSDDHQIVLISGSKCSVVYSDLIGDSPPFHRYFDENLSRKIAVNWYSWRIKQYGREPLQKWLNKTTPKIPREEYWALKQLGFRVPDKYEEVK
jgi:hypothetical protein